MATESLLETSTGHGPNGFLEFNQCYYAVTDGKISGLDGKLIGILHEDGLIEGKATPFDGWSGPKSIEELPGCIFRGIDSQGIALEIPSPSIHGPTGLLIYNTVPLTVIKGRIATKNHRLVGEMSDDGTIFLRDHRNPSKMHKVDETDQLHTDFKGIKSNGQPFIHQFERPLHKQKDKPYSDNEIFTYFDLDWHKLNDAEKIYIINSLKLWTRAGLLQLVRKATGAGRAMFGNVKHGASGVTGVITAYVTIDRHEFETEISLFQNYGVLSVHQKQSGIAEVRVNLVISHEYGHQMEMALSQACRDRIQDSYDAHMKRCTQRHALPSGYEGDSELLATNQINDRCFISGYARSSMHEYWAESLAAFSLLESREALRQIDPAIYKLLSELVYAPDKLLSPQYQESARKLQTSLRVGGELTNDLLDK